eukprot:NODE_1645_length_783_cov_79.772866_g1596_i0.p1 GENE.NODE_1645_length_783_cov_79.772866_g1596_i0~~NODE_1645_length_783_cov_79.772866_g1596_i0.p1  ORF type:complete len:203 (+),score=30.03 NODE_1645_length_783_cov_79.772866_g1596_i0:62-670(+)
MPFAETVRSHVSNREWSNLVHDCERFEVDQCSRSNKQELNTTFYATFLAASCIADDIVAARHIYKRIPAGIQKDSTIEAMWQVVVQLWNNLPAEAHSVLAAHTFPEDLKAVIGALQESLRSRTLLLYSQAYTNITVQDLATALALQPADAVAAAESAGAVAKKEGDYIYLKAIATSSNTPVDGPGGLQTMKRLAEHMLFIEK